MLIQRMFRIIREVVIGLWSYLVLCTKHYNSQQTVLLVEFNAFNGETLPGYVQYLQDLGFYVIVLTRYFVYSESPFVRLPIKPCHFCMASWEMRLFLNSRNAQKFVFILYNSAHLYLNSYYGTIEDYLNGKIYGGRKGFALIEHSLKPGADLDYFQKLPDEALAKQNLFHHSFVLTPQMIDGHVIPMLNPCYFGIVHNNHKLNDKRIFVTIGNVSSKSRNYKQLFDVLEQLDKQDFEIWIIGQIMEKDVVQRIPSCVNVLGRLKFAEMYNCLEKADFLLPLLDSQTQSFYLNGCTSGSRQLILGFSIPPVIHQAFAKHYGFTEESCLTYSSDDGFITALKRALTLKNDEYVAKRQELTRLAEGVYQESLDNLKKRLEMS